MSGSAELGPGWPSSTLQSGRPLLATHSASDETSQLERRLSHVPLVAGEYEETTASVPPGEEPIEDQTADSEAHRPGILGLFSRAARRRRHGANTTRARGMHRNWSANEDGGIPTKKNGSTGLKQKPGAIPRPAGSSKLGTFAGVFVPTTLNVISILMFLRFSFILGQSGIVGMLGMLLACYAIDLLTTMSLSAIATNGTVRGGGAYYLISRSLGPEFGGSIGIVFYLGLVFTTGMNAVGLVQCLKENFGTQSGHWLNVMPEGFGWEYLWATSAVVLCAGVCLAGSSLFARCNNYLLVILMVAAFSIPVSTLFVQPFEDRVRGLRYTGLRLNTFKDNLMPDFTKGAAGSKLDGRENFQDLFGILFPATSGIFAGASMSGDLKHPSKAIPKGTLYGLALTFFTYFIIILSIGCSVSRASLHRDANIVPHINLSSSLILLGEVATSFFSVLMGLIGSAKSLQALSRDGLVPGLSVFGYGTKRGDDPVYAILLSLTLAQLVMLSDINQIASFVAMAYLMTFMVMNLACFLLKISSAPNFRPRFRYFNWHTAGIGTIMSGVTMIFVDAFYASICGGILIVIFLIIHYTTPPKAWGDVSQSLIYHQVRKYLLRLREEHVKFWRPQILLLVNNPRRQYKLIQFCNSLKKGGLFILGHVIITKDFGSVVLEARRQQIAWTKYIDFSRIKAFVNVAISQGLEWGSRNLVLSGGLGGMRPNIVILGFYNLDEYRQSRPLVHVSGTSASQLSTPAQSPLRGDRLRKRNTKSATDALKGVLPTDAMRTEGSTDVRTYMTVLEDMLLSVRINVAVAKGFSELDIPVDEPSMMKRSLISLGLRSPGVVEGKNKKYIDLWPVQMSAELNDEDNPQKRNLLTTNFDTYTLILQLGCILNTVPRWKRAYSLRVAVFVEYESDVEEERGRVMALLWNLRIEAEVRVFWLASGALKSYEMIVNGNIEQIPEEVRRDINNGLRDEDWWHMVQNLRDKHPSSYDQELAELDSGTDSKSNQLTRRPGLRRGRMSTGVKQFPKLIEHLQKSRRHTSMSGLGDLGVSLGIRTHGLPPELVFMSSSSSEEDNDGSSSSEESENDFGAMTHSDLSGSEVRPTDSRSSVLPVNRRRTAKGTRSGPPSDTSDHQSTPTHPPRPKHARTPTNRSVTGESSSRLPKVTTSPDPASNSGVLTNASSTASLVQAATASRQQSRSKFSSRPTPHTTVSTDDGPGRSIMFADQPAPSDLRRQDTTNTLQSTSVDKGGRPQDPATTPPSNNKTTKPSSASGFPAHQALALSFNDLPCRAQYMILNELIRQESGRDAAVVFTTLPSPVEGTHRSEGDSVRYLTELEVLCAGLPPTLLVHSNSMTVTMNL